MDKNYAIKFVNQYGAVELIKTLYWNDEKSLGNDLLESCWGMSDEDIINYIEEQWNF